MSSIKHRHLSRSSAHRQALLRNMVTSLIEHERISTSLAKAKEVQRFAEKLITLGKKNTNATRSRAQAIFYQPHKHMPKLFGATPQFPGPLPEGQVPLRERYANRNGGYTRLLLCEPLKPDAAPSAILSLVDGPRDIRFAMTARTIARERQEGRSTLSELTAVNMRKVTRYRANGEEELESEVEKQMRVMSKHNNSEDMEWEHVDNAPGKVKWVRKDREDWERADLGPKPKWAKKRV
jgi:large subunit ribosomal protein L17